MVFRTELRKDHFENFGNKRRRGLKMFENQLRLVEHKLKKECFYFGFKKVDNAGYAVIPMLWSLIFGGFMRESQKKINKNSKKQKF